MSAQNVIILPVIRVEHDACVPLRGRVSPRAHSFLLNLANMKFGGDLERCVSELLEASARAVEEGQVQ
ncbi:MAG: hypothetical protein E6G97_02035 [Alphaproteobacteria bacterium]|nr:MAG: hypothetical protein E6G97_02035 [Alphaproteobacteria bacterium]